MNENNRNGDIYYRDKIGELFVGLTSMLYGGEIAKNGHYDHDNGKPDLIHWKKNQAYESKGRELSYPHILHPTQINLQEKFEKSDFPLTNPEIYYFLWQYAGRGISKVDEKNVNTRIINNLGGLLILSFDIIKKLKDFLEPKYYEGWGEVYSFKSSHRRRFMESPESSLEEIGLDKEDYRISNKQVKPNKYEYKEIYLPGFDITTIQNKNMRGVRRKRK